MYQINFNKSICIHFIGIGGISMSALASILLERGFAVKGSDVRRSSLTDLLEKRGAKIYFPQRAGNITGEEDVVVYTAAIHPDNPEYSESLKRGISMLTRAQLLGQLMDRYQTSIAVAGTHGKTTTTSMISCIMLMGGLDPTILVGGILKEIGGNMRIGATENFVTEACEYTNSFLCLRPKIALILNIDADHLDFFKDLNDIRNSFRRFAGNIVPGGSLIINGHIDRLSEITDGTRASIITYGTASSDYYPANITYDKYGSGTFDIIHRDENLGHFSLKIPGEHNIFNATAAIAAAMLCGVSIMDCRKGLMAFGGADRRFQKKGVLKNGAIIIDDYAHHPTEIRATLNAAKNYPHKKIWCVFQPHTYSRTKALMSAFAFALCLADEVVLTPIYAARETNNLGISSDTLRQNIANLGTDAYYFPSFKQIEDFLQRRVSDGDLIITMGAGDVVKIGEDLLISDKRQE